jgi:hypothetical protein
VNRAISVCSITPSDSRWRELAVKALIACRQARRAAEEFAHVFKLSTAAFAAWGPFRPAASSIADKLVVKQRPM